MNWAKIGLFAAGVLFGTAGIKVLGSKDAKKVYTETTAAALRAKECVMTTVTTIKENANDILTDAKEINEQRASCRILHFITLSFYATIYWKLRKTEQMNEKREPLSAALR